jgi:acetyl-CoA acetyltransferase
MWSFRDKYAIAGIGATAYSKNSGRPVRSLASEACLNAIKDAGLKPADIDGFVSFNLNDSVPGIAVATELGIKNAHYCVDLLMGGNAANLIILQAMAAIEAGLATNVLCFRAMNGRSGHRLGGAEKFEARGITQYTAPFGWITYPQAMAMWARRHMITYGTTEEHFGAIATTFRENAMLNPRAMQRKSLSYDEYLASRFIVEPFRMLDICLETDGACAVLVTSAERAKDMKRPPVLISGGAYGGGPVQGEDFFDAIRWPDHSHNCYKYIADDVWSRAGMGPSDIDVAQIYDCFTYSVIMALEGMGFCKEGEGGPFVTSGAIRRDGSLPLNTAGGLLSEGYIHGLNHVLEAVEQLRGDSGDRQIAGAETALTTAGAMSCGSALVLRTA